MKVTSYIKENWKNTIRIRNEDGNNKMGLPFPYTVPCINEMFDDMYYWDTYFTNKGLISCGEIEQAKNNVDDIANLINRWGYMPNGSNFDFLGRSQPPFFTAMVMDVYELIKDDNWLKERLNDVEKEYLFWTEKRNAENGLSRYYGDYSKEQCERFLDGVKNRIKVDAEKDRAKAGLDYFAEAESGWDFTARFSGDCTDYNPIDLNSLMYLIETSVYKIYDKLNLDGKKIWGERAERRKNFINSLLFDEEKGVYLDYNYKTKKHSEVLSCASFFPYFCGINDEDKIKGLNLLTDKLELDFGLSATEATEENYQWGYPNAWAPLHYIAVFALDKCNEKEKARRIATKYVKLVENNFEKTNGLWEKYNAKTGGIDAVSEYGTPQMMGWTAGVYIALKDYLEKE